MQLHLDEIATEITPGAHAILLLDQAGGHGAKGLSKQHLTLAGPATRPNSTVKRTLAVHAAELAVKSCLQILRRHRRSLLLGLEHAQP
jgi:hypothetical protein